MECKIWKVTNVYSLRDKAEEVQTHFIIRKMIRMYSCLIPVLDKLANINFTSMFMFCFFHFTVNIENVNMTRFIDIYVLYQGMNENLYRKCEIY